MFEERDFRRRPAATAAPGPSWLLLLGLVNLGVLVLRQLFNAQASPPAGAISVAALHKGEWWTVFTHGFIHADWLHLLPNLALLLVVGRRVLADIGPRLFLYLYLIGGCAAAAASLLLHPLSPLIGASGSIMALIGGYAALHPDRSVTTGMGAWVPRLSATNAFLGLLASSVALEAFSLATSVRWSIPFVHNQAHAAHAAGLLTGWIYARHFTPPLPTIFHREEFFPQGLRRRHADAMAIAQPSPAHQQDRSTAPAPAPPPLNNDEVLRQSVDPVLEKLYLSGMTSLTEDERRILGEAAQRFGTSPT